MVGNYKMNYRAKKKTEKKKKNRRLTTNPEDKDTYTYKFVRHQMKFEKLL